MRKQKNEVKNSKIWIWIVAILILLGAGYFIYILFTNPGAVISGPGSLIP